MIVELILEISSLNNASHFHQNGVIQANDDILTESRSAALSHCYRLNKIESVHACCSFAFQHLQYGFADADALSNGNPPLPLGFLSGGRIVTLRETEKTAKLPHWPIRHSVALITKNSAFRSCCSSVKSGLVLRHIRQPRERQEGGTKLVILPIRRSDAQGAGQ
jgi:hypothetical protein